jgi:hypothetical protein
MLFPSVNINTEGHSEKDKLDIYKESGKYEGRVSDLNASFFFVYLSLKP